MFVPVGYRLASYGGMITAGPRMEAYIEALKQVMRPGNTVLDIGAGTGIFSLLACQLGAGHVHAVEPNDAIKVAHKIASTNGYSDRITFHQTVSSSLTLPSPADVIISDLRGILPLLEHHISSIADARARLLAPGGRIIPQLDTLWASLIENAELYRPYMDPWVQNNYGLDMRDGKQLVVNTWRKVNAKPEHLLTPPQCWATLDYRTIVESDVKSELSWVIERAGTAHGLLVWFDAELVDNINFSNAPAQPELVYGQGFFPFEDPITLDVGERVAARLMANLIGNEYIWRWDTDVFAATRPPQPRISFRQSTFFSSLLPLDRLRKRGDQFAPSLSEEGQLDLTILNLMSQEMPLGLIARQIAEQFSSRFSSWGDALARVSDLSEKYAR